MPLVQAIHDVVLGYGAVRGLAGERPGGGTGIAGRIHVRCSLRQQATFDLSAQRVVIEARQG